jgi:hypothetical protein
MSSVRFTLDEFDLAEGQLDEAFGDYGERYGHLF